MYNCIIYLRALYVLFIIKIHDFILGFQLVLTALTAANLNVVPYSGDEEVALSLYRDERFFPGLILGTYWCGAGNVSRGPNELGPNFLVDSCCYDHDHCRIYIEPGEHKYGTTNDHAYTQVSCFCDDKFYQCLQSVNTWTAWLVIKLYGSTYPKCIEEHFELLCKSPEGDYNSNPCAGLRCGNNCERFEKYVEVDSKFKIHQIEKDREEANLKKEERNMMMFHQLMPPSMIYPTVMHIFNRSP